MVVIGSITKSVSNNNSIPPFLIGDEWESILFENKNIHLEVHYDPSSNIRVINNDTNMLISDDKLFIIENGFPVFVFDSF